MIVGALELIAVLPIALTVWQGPAVEEAIYQERSQVDSNVARFKCSRDQRIFLFGNGRNISPMAS
jgi:hypothetical protein